MRYIAIVTIVTAATVVVAAVSNYHTQNRSASTLSSKAGLEVQNSKSTDKRLVFRSEPSGSQNDMRHLPKKITLQKQDGSDLKNSVLDTLNTTSEQESWQTLQMQLESGDLVTSDAYTIVANMAIRNPDANYLASIVPYLADVLQRNNVISHQGALEAAYSAVIQALRDDGRSEFAQYLAQHALTVIPDSVEIRSQLATALMDRLYFSDAAGILQGIREPDFRIQAQIATLEFRRGNVSLAVEMASNLRAKNSEVADLVGEIPEPSWRLP